MNGARSRRMLSAFRLSLGASLLSLGLVACAGNVVVDGNNGDLGQGVGLGQGQGGGSQATSSPPSTGTSTPPSTGTGDPPPHPTPALPPAIALRYGDVNGGPMGGGGAEPGGDPLSPDDTLLVVSGYGAECASPHGPAGCTRDWRILLVVPQAKLAAGAVFDLPNANAWFQATEPGSNGDCSQSAGTLLSGTLALTGLDADGSVRGHLAGLDLLTPDVPTELDFVAVRCASHAPQPDAPACAGTGGSCTSDADCCNQLCNPYGHCDP